MVPSGSEFLRTGRQHTNEETDLVEEDRRMKRQKRDRLERAHAQGYRAGVTGRSKEICPYQGIEARSQWLGGYREAMEDRGGGLFNKGQ